MTNAQVKNTNIDISTYRQDFPIFDAKMNGKTVAYLDSASSAQKPKIVLDTMRNLYENNYANIHRGLYAFSQETTNMFEAVRGKIAEFINALSSEEIIFTRNTTEAINLVAQSWGRTNLKKGDEVLITEMEHHANIVPWQLLETQIGIKVKVVPVLDDDGTLDFGAFVSLLSEKTKMVAVVHASNALGTINPVAKIVKAAKEFNSNIMTLVDGSQSVVHSAVNVQDIGCDFFTFTGHKLYGPNGIGVLWGRADVLREMPPYQGGGDMIETVSFKEPTTFKTAPARFEAGTPAIGEVIGLGAAIDYVSAIGMENIAEHEKRLLDIMMRELSTIDGLTYYGTAQDKVGVVSFTADWAHASDIAMILDQQGVAVRTGHHCCMPLMERFGIDATVRASLGLYSNENDIQALVSGLKKAKEMLS
jgi:cysteine desulfurase/selenocysteine lyase